MNIPHRSVPAGQFKAECLGILDRVAQNREPVVVTKRGRPVAMVVPLEPESPSRSLKGSVRIDGDIVEPTGEIWQADV